MNASSGMGMVGAIVWMNYVLLNASPSEKRAEETSGNVK